VKSTRAARPIRDRTIMDAWKGCRLVMTVAIYSVMDTRHRFDGYCFLHSDLIILRACSRKQLNMHITCIPGRSAQEETRTAAI
jgi:hypothetical protein